MKPISELVNDREACDRIAELIMNSPCKNVQVGEAEAGLVFRIHTDTGYYTPMFLFWDGTVTLQYEVYWPTFNPFAFVALMNELGYGPDPATTSSLPSEYTPPHTGS